MEISVEVLKWATLILLGVQGIKKLPWVETVLEKWLGGWAGMVLPLLAALAAGFVEYSGDGKLTAQECMEIIGGLVAAMGTHTALKAARSKRPDWISPSGPPNHAPNPGRDPSVDS